MSNGAGTDSLNNNCICISTVGATVMIWEKFYVEIQGGQVTPLPLPEGAHGGEGRGEEGGSSYFALGRKKSWRL